MAEFRADLHYHPNFDAMSIYNNEHKAKKILEGCLQHNLTVLAVTEHSYKKPIEAFEILYKTQQELINSGDPKYQGLKNLFLFPGVEYLTSEGGEVVLFHNSVDEHGNAQLHHVMRKHPGLLKPHAYSVAQVLSIADQYGIAFYFPHPYETKTGGIARFGRAIHSKNFQHRIAQIAHNRRIGMSIHNGAFDSVSDILKQFHIKVPFFQKLTNTPTELIMEANPKFFGGGSDAHTPELMGSGLSFHIYGKVTRDNLYKSIIDGKIPEIFESKKRVVDYFLRLKGGLIQLAVTLPELLTEKMLEKLIEEDKEKLLEAYVKAWEAELPYEQILKFKEIFPGEGFMLGLSHAQRKRVKRAIEKRKQQA